MLGRIWMALRYIAPRKITARISKKFAKNRENYPIHGESAVYFLRYVIATH